MNNNFDIDELTRKTKRLEYMDGLRDFQLGAIFLILGLANGFFFTPAGLDLFARMVLRFRDLLLVVMGGFVGLTILLAVGSERAMERIRRATFWRESGFVRPLRRGIVKKSVLVLATIVLLGIIIGSVWLMSKGILSQEDALRSIPASVGLATAVIFISIGINLRLRRYVLVGITGTILSAFILITDMAFAIAYLWTGIGWAAIFSLSGLWALGSALRDLRGGALNG